METIHAAAFDGDARSVWEESPGRTETMTALSELVPASSTAAPSSYGPLRDMLLGGWEDDEDEDDFDDEDDDEDDFDDEEEDDFDDDDEDDFDDDDEDDFDDDDEDDFDDED